MLSQFGLCSHRDKRTLAVRGNIAVQLVFSLAGLDSVVSAQTYDNIFVFGRIQLRLNWRPAVQRPFPYRCTMHLYSGQ